MADKSIGDLNFAPGTVDDSNTLFVVQQSGAAYKLSGHEFIIAMESVLDGHGGINSIVYTPPVAPSLTGTMVITLADQSTTSVSIQNGKGIATITDYWKASSSSSSVPSSWSTTRESMTSTNRYLWHYQHIVYNDNTYLDTTKTVVGVYGDTGDAWYVWIRYSGSQPTQDSDMGTTPDNWMGIYSGTSSTAPVHYTSYQWFQIKGDKGDTGNPATITNTAVEYQVSTSGTVVPSGTWTATVPSVTQGDFLWTRTTLEFNSGSPIVSYAVAYQAIDGQGAPSSATPLMDAGAGSAGTGTAFSRDDHIHPTDTTRQATLVSGTNIKTVGGTTLLGSGNIAFPVTSVNNETGSVALDALDVGATELDLIWENASPTSAFGAQTLSLNLTNYDAVLIKMTLNNTSQYESTTSEGAPICFKGKASASFNGIINNQSFNMERLAIVGNSGIEFSTGYANMGTGDQYAVPLQIYGIKGVIRV